MVTQVVDLLKEYEYIFTKVFSKMEGIARELGETKIQLIVDSKMTMKRPYQLNHKYKKKVQGLDKMLELATISTVEESKWIFQMLLQDKNM